MQEEREADANEDVSVTMSEQSADVNDAFVKVLLDDDDDDRSHMSHTLCGACILSMRARLKMHFSKQAPAASTLVMMAAVKVDDDASASRISHLMKEEEERSHAVSTAATMTQPSNVQFCSCC